MVDKADAITDKFLKNHAEETIAYPFAGAALTLGFGAPQIGKLIYRAYTGDSKAKLSDGAVTTIGVCSALGGGIICGLIAHKFFRNQMGLFLANTLYRGTEDVQTIKQTLQDRIAQAKKTGKPKLQ